MPPFAGNGVGPGEERAVDGDAAADARAEDDAEDGGCARRRAIGCFGEGETIGIVCEADLAPECGFEIFSEGMADEPGAVRVFHEAGGGRDCARHTDADSTLLSGFGFEGGNEIANGGDGGGIVAARRGHALARALIAAFVEGDGFNLCAAEVYADAHSDYPFFVRRISGLKGGRFSAQRRRDAEGMLSLASNKNVMPGLAPGIQGKPIKRLRASSCEKRRRLSAASGLPGQALQ
tara:strand:- start:15168 stop:15872 length:705 start_codon:yes stop_codon:yes gene_type:complete